MSDFGKDSPHSQEGSEPSIRFLQITHSAENAVRVWEEAKKHDVVLLEVYDLSDAQREDLENTINGMSSIEDPESRMKTLGNLYSDSGFAQQIIRQAILEGKEFHFIDISSNHDAHVFYERAEAYSNEVFKYFYEGVFDKSLSSLRAYVAANSQANTSRENLVSRQVKNLVSENQKKMEG
ncbi:MAG: hypothetical protein HYV90_04690 [Candidatus Woesebacteria bacterium]|nr:MAG: hypothetical protein HYV90_04690 [Candidatus Woesebacteria bacterium]